MACALRPAGRLCRTARRPLWRARRTAALRPAAAVGVLCRGAFPHPLIIFPPARAVPVTFALPLPVSIAFPVPNGLPLHVPVSIAPAWVAPVALALAVPVGEAAIAVVPVAGAPLCVAISTPAMADVLPPRAPPPGWRDGLRGSAAHPRRRRLCGPAQRKQRSIRSDRHRRFPQSSDVSDEFRKNL